MKYTCGQQGGKKADCVGDQAETAASKQRYTHGMDKKSRAWNIAKADQTRQLLGGNVAASVEGNRCFGADGKAADKSHHQCTSPCARDAEQAAQRSLPQLAQNLPAAAFHQ